MQENNANGNRRLIYMVIAAGLVTAALFTNEIIEAKNKAIEKLERTRQDLLVQLGMEQEANATLRTENDSLRRENSVLRDSIGTLHERVADLEQKLKRAKGDLSKTRHQLDIARKKLKEAEAKARTAPDGSAAEAKYQAQVAALNNQITNLTKQKEALKHERDSLQHKLVSHKPEPGTPPTPQSTLAAPTVRLAKILNDTRLVVHAVVCSKTASTGKPIKKLEPNGRNWTYTTFQFDLENPDPDAIFEEKFVLKIVDADSGQPIPYLEKSSTGYGDGLNETVGIDFKWLNKPQRLQHKYLQDKPGQNYRVEIYFKDDNRKEHRLPNATYTFIRNGEVVAPAGGAY
ncbi:MAG: hypothetical protein ACK4Q5_02380 [Saprospiraceae bacterium]